MEEKHSDIAKERCPDGHDTDRHTEQPPRSYPPAVEISSSQDASHAIHLPAHESRRSAHSELMLHRCWKAPRRLAQRRPLSRLSQCAGQLLRGQSVGEEKLVAKSRAVIPTKTVLTSTVDGPVIVCPFPSLTESCVHLQIRLQSAKSRSFNKSREGP